MQVASLSTAMAAVGAACQKPHQKIVPFVRRPEEVVPGNPLHFATAYGLDGYASGLLVVSHEGRPTKVEGNPAHPQTLGATTSFEQSLTLSVYDDDRAKQIRTGSRPLAWRTFLAETAVRANSLAQNRGAGLRFLIAPTTSPFLTDLRRRILERFPGAKFVSYASLADDGAVEGAKLAFGKPLVPRHKAAPANVILSLDADFLGEGNEQTRLSREFAARREPSRQMSRLYVVEPAMTITGSMADHRLRLQGSEVAAFLASLISMLASRGLAALAPLASLTHGAAGWDPKWLVALATDLERSRGNSLIIAGRRQPAAVHALVAALNVALGNLGNTVEFGAPLTSDATDGRRAARRARPGHRRGRRRHAGHHGVEPGLRRRPSISSSPSCSSACRTPSITRSTRTRRPPRSRPSSRPRTRWSRGATCARPTAPCRSCSR